MSSTETKRVAELLSQLPPELDVEAMVEESWLVVADTQLDKSGLSVWDPKVGARSAGGGQPAPHAGGPGARAADHHAHGHVCCATCTRLDA